VDRPRTTDADALRCCWPCASGLAQPEPWELRQRGISAEPHRFVNDNRPTCASDLPGRTHPEKRCRQPLLGVFDRERSRKTTPSNLEISTADGRTIAAIASIHKETRHLNHAPRPLASQQSVESDAEPGYNTGPNGNGFVTATPRPGSSTPAPSRASVSSPHPNIPSDFPPGVCHLQPWRNNRLSAPTIRFVAKLPSLPPPLPHPLPFHGSPTSTMI
jgi:hypothetical protein